jgi:hypothetical protein
MNNYLFNMNNKVDIGDDINYDYPQTFFVQYTN